MNDWLLDIVGQLQLLVEQKHKENKIGCALILYGDADTCKSTILRLLSLAFQPSQLWVGTQWLGEDNLRWDTCTRMQARTLITEEMMWFSVAKKQTIEDTVIKIKEQLTGAGANNRLSKTGAKTQHTQSNLHYFFFSMNNYPLDGTHIRNLITMRAEYSKRFIVLDMNPYKGYIQQHIRKNPDWDEEAFIKTLTNYDFKLFITNKINII